MNVQKCKYIHFRTFVIESPDEITLHTHKIVPAVLGGYKISYIRI